MKTIGILLSVLIVSMFLISFSSAVFCVDGSGKSIDTTNTYCDGSILITDSCVGSSAYREQRDPCQFGCDSVNKVCRADNLEIYSNDLPTGSVTQEVTCRFSNSNVPQYCSYGQFNCTGTDSCLIRFYGMPGDNVSLTSSCAGTPNVNVNGAQRTASFDCKSQNKGFENVTCIFKNAAAEERCFSGNYSCTGVGQCSVPVNGTVGDKFVWKSSCGGDDYTVLDSGNQKGGNDYVLFYCGGDEQIPAFKQAYTLCYDGYDLYKGSQDDCRTEEAWKYVMDAVCDGRCAGSNYCGSKRFKAFTPCGNITFIRPTGNEGIVLNGTNSQCQGCSQDDQCYAFGYRGKSDYCLYDGSIKNYSVVGEACEKDYQCKSNSCVNSVCGPNGFFEKVNAWFKGLFKK